jgi:uridine kinase
MRAWLSENGDYNAWRAPGLAKRLQQLKEGVAVGSTGKPARYVVFDAPLGRAHTETGKYIDHMVFIDTPLDVALARRMLRDGHEVWNGDHLRRYLHWARGLFTHHIEKVSASADVILDGTLPVDALASLVAAKFNLKSGG